MKSHPWAICTPIEMNGLLEQKKFLIQYTSKSARRLSKSHNNKSVSQEQL